jgi:hypothetical protein
MWYLDRGVPLLLVHDTYCSSMPCMIAVNIFFILIIGMLFFYTGKPSQ